VTGITLHAMRGIQEYSIHLDVSFLLTGGQRVTVAAFDQWSTTGNNDGIAPGCKFNVKLIDTLYADIK